MRKMDEQRQGGECHEEGLLEESRDGEVVLLGVLVGGEKGKGEVEGGEGSGEEEGVEERAERQIAFCRGCARCGGGGGWCRV